MNAYERVMAVFHKQVPDRVPIFEFMIDPKVIHGILPGGTYLDLAEALDIDCVSSCTPSRMYNLQFVRNDGNTPLYRTEWGEIRASTGEMVMIPVDHPLKTYADWETYQVPDPDKPGRFDDLKAIVARYKGKRAICAHLHDSFSHPAYIFGMSELFINLILEPDWVKEVVAACTAHSLRMIELAVAAGADFILTGDDVGGKSGPMMSPAHYEKFFLPGLAAVVQKAHDLGVPFVKHTDGNVDRLLPMFVEAGIDAFHPSDPSAGMDIAKVKQQYADRFLVCGGIDTGDPLISWPMPTLVKEVRRRIDELAPGGRWMIASSNTVHASVRPQNYHAMVMAIRTYGNYGCLNQPISAEMEAAIGKIPLQPAMQQA